MRFLCIARPPHQFKVLSLLMEAYTHYTQFMVYLVHSMNVLCAFHIQQVLNNFMSLIYMFNLLNEMSIH